MLRHARQLESFELCAPDGRIGHVTDFFFDDRRWTIRYLVVDTGTWLDHREVLISPAAAHAPDWQQRIIPVDLTREQVRNSPCIDTEEPVSRDQELALIEYYSWPMYWGVAGYSDTLLFATPPFLPGNFPRNLLRAELAADLDQQHHVRSVEDVRGYRLDANDGTVGHVEDFLVDDTNWTLAYLVVETRAWWPGKRVLVAPEWIYEVGWDEAVVGADLTREAIRRSPPYDVNLPISLQYVHELHEHYGQPRRSAEP